MEIQYPDYRNCVANLACSILNYYGITPPNSTLAYADQYLNKKYKNVVLLLLDGMGTSTIDKHLKCDGFFNKNLKYIYSSTFPSTTVAATTAIESGLFPNQSAWVGWSSYFKDINKNIAYFRNCDNDTFELIENMDVAKKFVPYVGIREQINNTGIETHCVSPFNNMVINTYDDFCQQIKLLCSSNEMKYIYAYWEEPDKSMHIYGEESAEVHNNLINIEEKTKHLASELQDTLLIITADHGQINVNNKSLLKYPDLIDCLVRMPSVKARACNFFVKKGKKEIL